SAAMVDCASVIGVDDYQDAIAEMCKCNDQLEFLGSDCVETLSGRLDGASESTRQNWLNRFADQSCAECNHTLECYYAPPTCGTTTCSSSKECCGYEDRTGYCFEGQCVREDKGCLALGKPCAAANQCCGSEANASPALAECSAIFVDSGEQPNCKEYCGTAPG